MVSSNNYTSFTNCCDAIEFLLHPIDTKDYADQCRHDLEATGALVLKRFFSTKAIKQIVEQSADCEAAAYYARSTHNVYLTEQDPALGADHTFNRQVVSSKGLIADNQIPEMSPLRTVYNDERFRTFLCGVLGISEIHPYADEVSSINIHFAPEGRELGWHFDNSAFAVTMLLQAPEAGGVFEYVPAVRDAEAGDMAYDRVAAILDQKEPVRTLEFDPGDLVLFRGRDAMHRVTPTLGDVTRMLVVFAFNERAGICLSEAARATFYGTPKA